MSIQKIDVVHLIGGLSSAAGNLVNVVNSGDATKAILSAITKLATELAASPVSDTNLVAKKTEKSA